MVVDASWANQPREGSQQAFMILRSDKALFEGEALVNAVDWSSGKIHRKVRSTLAAERRA